MQRRDFYYRQRVTEAELDDTFDQSEDAQWNIVNEILGHGFFASPVPVQASVPNLTIDIPACLAYDQLGRRCEVPAGSAPYNQNMAVDEVAASTAVVGGGNEKILAIFMEFDRTLSDPRTDGNATTVYWERNEWFKFNTVQSAEAPLGTAVKPPLRSNQVLLCYTTLIFGQTTILSGGIDVTDREDFTLTQFLHGPSHREFGTDPEPNATTIDGGNMSAVDKTKMDTITWTPIGISSELGFIGRAFQPVNITQSATTTEDVSTELAAKTAGGGNATTKGVVTTAPGNLVKIYDVNLDSFLDPSGDKVYGRITVDNPVTPTTWTLSFFVYDEGVGETPYDMSVLYSGATIVWYIQEVYSLDSFPVLDPCFAIQSDQIAGEIPDATTTTKGKVQLATNGETTAGKAVQGSDSRLLASNALSAVPKLASQPSLIFMPLSSTPFTNYRLHQLHAMAKGDFQTGGSPYEPAPYYFEYDISNAAYPLQVQFSGTPTATPQPGIADNTVPAVAVDTAYYVYVIARDAAGSPPDQALVFSSRAPWQNGPLLDDSSFNFWNGGIVSANQGGWRYWRFVGCVINRQAGSWQIVPMRKIGNHVEYDLGQVIYHTIATTAFTDRSCVTRMPPTSMRGFFRVVVGQENPAGGGTQTEIFVRPPGAGTMLMLDTPVSGPPTGGPVWTVPTATDYKLWAFQFSPVTGGADILWNVDTAWCDTNTSQDIGVKTNAGGPGAQHMWVELLGYEEFTDTRATELTF